MEWNKKVKADLSARKSEVIELLETALEAVGNVVEALSTASDEMSDLPYEYNITGNMDAYVINYLTGSTDCISGKIEEYIEQTEALSEGQSGSDIE